jgi:hypothetical protein
MRPRSDRRDLPQLRDLPGQRTLAFPLPSLPAFPFPSGMGRQRPQAGSKIERHGTGTSQDPSTSKIPQNRSGGRGPGGRNRTSAPDRVEPRRSRSAMVPLDRRSMVSNTILEISGNAPQITRAANLPRDGPAAREPSAGSPKTRGWTRNHPTIPPIANKIPTSVTPFFSSVLPISERCSRAGGRKASRPGWREPWDPCPCYPARSPALRSIRTKMRGLHYGETFVQAVHDARD